MITALKSVLWLSLQQISLKSWVKRMILIFGKQFSKLTSSKSQTMNLIKKDVGSLCRASAKPKTRWILLSNLGLKNITLILKFKDSEAPYFEEYPRTKTSGK